MIKPEQPQALIFPSPGGSPDLSHYKALEVVAFVNVNAIDAFSPRPSKA